MFVEHKEAGEVAKTKNETLKVSEAIRIGARLRPQCARTFFSDYGESCALGAAMEVMYGTNRMNFTPAQRDAVLEQLPIDLTIQIIGRNDSGNYTREQIADWLESQGY